MRVSSAPGNKRVKKQKKRIEKARGKPEQSLICTTAANFAIEQEKQS
jgi:hypothetical protein